MNVIGTLNVFDSVKHLKDSNISTVECVVTASSAGICGPAATYEGGICHDDSFHRPVTHYGTFKLANEGNARTYWTLHGIPSVALRPLTVYGVGREVGLTSSPTKAAKAVVLGHPYEIGFSGSTCFNYVEDIADIFIACVEKVKQGAHACCIQGINLTTSNIPVYHVN